MTPSSNTVFAAV